MRLRVQFLILAASLCTISYPALAHPGAGSTQSSGLIVPAEFYSYGYYSEPGRPNYTYGNQRAPRVKYFYLGHPSYSPYYYYYPQPYGPYYRPKLRGWW